MNNQPQVFGTLLGYAPGNVAAYSSDYDSVDPKALPDRHAYRHYVDGVYTGYKWQCVEFARRWLLLNKGYVFEDIAMAYDIFKLRHVNIVGGNKTLPLQSFNNGSKRAPEPGCMLIWNEGGEFELTGHVAIVTEVFDDCIRIAEQNVDHECWPEGRDYARELPARRSDDGGYWIKCSYVDGDILGWVIQTSDQRGSIKVTPPNPKLFNLKLAQVKNNNASENNWLNIANSDEYAYVQANGCTLTSVKENQNRFFVSQPARKRN